MCVRSAFVRSSTWDSARICVHTYALLARAHTPPYYPSPSSLSPLPFPATPYHLPLPSHSSLTLHPSFFIPYPLPSPFTVDTRWYCPTIFRFKSDVFLSCSADWSVRLWQRGAPEATSVLQSASCAVRSAVWSPHSSTVIASISDATVDVWDLSVKSQDPIITMDLTVSGDSLLSCVSFSPTANAIVVRHHPHPIIPCNTLPSQEAALHTHTQAPAHPVPPFSARNLLQTGDSSGRVTFSLLRNVPDCSHDTREHQVARLLAALAPTQGRG